jgi:glycosyltransferase involved in cell wall biosynthesis
LVEELARQIGTLDFPCELVLIDDSSKEEFRKINESVCAPFNYVRLPENMGRAKIRNLFLQYAKHDFLLFLDCDSIIINPGFILDYAVNLIQNEPNVICGGRIYPAKCDDRDRMLRWKYGVMKESQPAKVRRMNPDKSFMTNNFLIHRSLLSQISFDETLVGYGHEDTLFGFYLKQQGIEIMHIENPVLNGDLETNREFLEKTECGIDNLCRIVRKLNFDKEFIADVSLLRFFDKLRKYHVAGLLNLVFWIKRPVVKWMLIHGFNWIWLFDLYKLGLLSKNISRSKAG